MQEFCVYITIYSGNLLPPFYIGSTQVKNIEKGYRGSVESKKWKKIWLEELKNNPDLFETHIIPNQYAETREKILEMELYFQKAFDVVKICL